MKKSEIDKIKKDGAKEKMLQKIGALLWEIGRAAERAPKDYYKNLLPEINKIRKFTDDAEDLGKEAFPVDVTYPPGE